jgi:hypothetical protein
MTVAELRAGSLVRAGTPSLVGVPGGASNLDLIDAARVDPRGYDEMAVALRG